MGLFQINSVHFKRFPLKDLVDCDKNIKAAKQLQQESGWYAWATYKEID